MATLEKEAQILPDLNTKYAYVLPEKNEKRNNVFDERGVARRAGLQTTIKPSYKKFYIMERW